MGLPCSKTARHELSVSTLTAHCLCCPPPCTLKETGSLPDGDEEYTLWVLRLGAGVGWSPSTKLC